MTDVYMRLRHNCVNIKDHETLAGNLMRMKHAGYHLTKVKYSNVMVFEKEKNA